MSAIHHISSDLAPISDATLTPTQAQVIAALAKGQTITAAAREAGIHRTTIHHWLRIEPDFNTAVENAQHEYVATLNDEMRELSALALATLRSQLEDPATPPSVRLRAALAVLNRPKFPKQGWALPERLESPQQQHALDTLAAIEADYRAMRLEEAIQGSAARVETPTEPSAAQQAAPDRQPPPSRCSPCPCGSGRKYKRCCGAHGVIGSRDAPSRSDVARAA
jgi:hypothetical protein